MTLRWTKQAGADLDKIFTFIAEHDRAAAIQMTTRLLQAIERLEDFPASGRPGRVFGTRELVVSRTPYVVPYRIRGDEIQILSIFHAARHWPPSF